MKSFNLVLPIIKVVTKFFKMKRKESTFVYALLITLLLFSSCKNETENRDFIIPENHPATALTIGWYVPVDAMTEIVGQGFKPKVVGENGMTSVMLYIVQGNEHILDGTDKGPVRTAHLVIPVEPDGDVSVPSRAKNIMVCPITIVDKSIALGDKYNTYDFPTYSGDISLNATSSGDKYNVDATIKTVNGFIEIKGMFEEKGKNQELNSAIFTSRQGFHSYFYGEENMQRIEDGKGNLKLDGQNIITAMQLDKLPYYLKLDRNVSWAFDFVK